MQQSHLVMEVGQGIHTLTQQILVLVQVVVMLVAQATNIKQELFVIQQLGVVLALGQDILIHLTKLQELVQVVVM